MSKNPSKPNLLFVMLDCMRADYFYGERGPALPGLAPLLQRSYSARSFYSVATTTTPCTATVLTGLYPLNHGVRGHLGFRLRPEVQTLAGYLQAQGYHTVARTTGPLATETDIQRGFADFQHRPPEETLFGPFGGRFWQELAELQQGDRPWFLFLHVWALHMPLPAPWREKLGYNFPAGPLLAGFQWLDLALLTRLWRLVRGQRAAATEPSIVQSERQLGSRRRTVKRLGRQLLYQYKKVAYERTLAALDRTFFGPLARQLDLDKTVLAMIGDHGEFVDRESDGIADGYRLYRRPAHSFHVYDYLTRVPFLLAGPGVPQGQLDRQPANQTDLVPTLLARLTGRPAGAQFDGIDLLAEERPSDRPLFLESVGGGHLEGQRYLRAVRRGDWKFIEGPWMPGYQEELYNLAQDPQERHNLRLQEPAQAETLRTLLARHFAADAQGLGAAAGADSQMAGEDLAVVEERLRELGYLD